jgi:hypothetical protein
MLDKDLVAEIVERNPKVDPTAVNRSRDAARRLEEAGIRIGAYSLQHPLGGALLRHLDQPTRRMQSEP